MKKIYLLLMSLAFIMSACNSKKVKIRGEVTELQGSVKVMAEVPGQQGLVLIGQQDVADGKINIATELLELPGRVWIDIAGKITLETIIDSKDQIWIQGKAKFPDQIEVKGSGLDIEYLKQKKTFKEKYEGPIEPIDRSINRIMNKEQKSKDDEVMLGVYHLQRLRYVRARANYAKALIEANSNQELSILLIQDELKDSVVLQKRLFKQLTVPNKESNAYKTLAQKMQ